jgi:hypothetical protein
MMVRAALGLIALAALAACDLPPPDPAVVARECAARAQAAQGPTGSATIGINSDAGRARPPGRL